MDDFEERFCLPNIQNAILEVMAQDLGSSDSATAAELNKIRTRAIIPPISVREATALDTGAFEFPRDNDIADRVTAFIQEVDTRGKCY